MYQFKAALNDTWDVSYGLKGSAANISLSLSATTPVKFYYDHKTHDVQIVASNVFVAVGDWQNQVGCLSANDPTCLRGFMTDTDSDGFLDVVTPPIPPGTWHLQVNGGEPPTLRLGAGCMDGGAPVPFTVPAGPAQPVYFVVNTTSLCINAVIGGRPKGDIKLAKAHWLDPTTIAWDLGKDAQGMNVVPPANAVAELLYSNTAGMVLDLTQGSITGASTPITLTHLATGMPAALAAKYPHLANLQVFRLSSAPLTIKDILKGQMAVSLDSPRACCWTPPPCRPPACWTTSTPRGQNVALGATLNAGTPTLRVWAPTAQA